MNKIWNISKYFFIVIGVISTIIFLYIFVAIMLSSINNAKTTADEEKSPIEIYETTNAGIHLQVFRDYANQGRIVVSASQGNLEIVKHFQLPTQPYEAEDLIFSDTTLIPLGRNEYGIVFVSTNRDCDHCENGSQVWLLKLDTKLKFIKKIPLLDLHKLDKNANQYLANFIIHLPYVENMKSEQFILPARIEIGRKVKITPILDRNSLDLYKLHFDSVFKTRLESIADSEKSELRAEHMEVAQKFKEMLSVRQFSF